MLVTGILVGAPLGAGLLWSWRAPSGVSPRALLASAPAAPTTGAEPGRGAPGPAALPSAATPAQPMQPMAAKSAAPTVPLTIRAQPTNAADAHVILDGKPIGRAPVTVQVAPGEHQIALNKSHYRNLTETLSAPGERELTMIHR
jgi:hypothetical protein